MKLEPGESRIVSIRAREFWNDSGITLETGQLYRMGAVGRWTDLSIPTDADGFTSADVPWFTRWLMRRAERSRRMPRENWFKLIGSFDQDETRAFPIGTSQTLTAQHSGQLTCYANDKPGFYWNNRGSVDLTVTRI